MAIPKIQTLFRGDRRLGYPVLLGFLLLMFGLQPLIEREVAGVELEALLLAAVLLGAIAAVGRSRVQLLAGAALGSVLRSFEDAGIAVTVRVAPELDAVRAVHAQGVTDVELFTGYLVDLPDAERRGALVTLGDTARLASKLRLGHAVAGGLDDRNVGAVLAAAPSVERVVFGRGLARRALLVGIDRAVRDFRERMR